MKSWDVAYSIWHMGHSQFNAASPIPFCLFHFPVTGGSYHV